MELIPESFFVPSGHPVARFVESEKYVKNFGSQWHRFPKTQLDSYSRLSLSCDRLKRCMGQDLWQNSSGKMVLEVGAGAGRFTEILLERKAKVFSIDLSSAIDVNASNFPPNQNHALAQADVMDLPFKVASFDIVICLGVIQHTPNPEATIAKLADQVKPGGWLVIDHYCWTPAAVSLRSLYRQAVKRLPPAQAMRAIAGAARVFLPLHRAFKNYKFMSVLLNRFSPMITYYSAFPELDESAQREWALLDTYDGLSDWHKHFRNCAQIKNCLTELGLENIEIKKAGNGVEARAQKPMLKSNL